jgi:hypothetical protein
MLLICRYSLIIAISIPMYNTGLSHVTHLTWLSNSDKFTHISNLIYGEDWTHAWLTQWSGENFADIDVEDH